MVVPTYTRIDATEVDSESPINASLMARFKNNVLALLGVDEAAVSPSVTLGFRGEILATRAGLATHNATVGVAAPGPYTWVVPTGVTKIIVELCGGGGGGNSSSNGGTGGTSSVVGSTSGTLCQGLGGLGGTGGGAGFGAGGAASGTFGAAGGDGLSAGGGAGRYRFATPPAAFTETNTVVYIEVGGIGGFGGRGGSYDSAAAVTGFGNGGGCDAAHGAGRGGGGGAGAEGMFTVVPGETLTLTVGAGGTSGGGNSAAGAPGMIRIRF